jgi:allantoinase
MSALISSSYPRDLVGYGEHVPHARWPGGARVALQFVVNYEEGAENSVLHGDPASETFLSEIVGAQPFAQRHMSMESLYEYGARAGVWRLLRCLRERRVPVTVFGVGMALERNPMVVEAALRDGHEIASHGWRWISYQQIDEYIEREDLVRAVESITRLTGKAPEGWYSGRDSPNTRRLLVEHGGFAYCADGYADDLPYWVPVRTRLGTAPLLIVPYTLDTNDMLYAEGDPQGLDAPKLLSIGLHCRLIGRPARIAALARFIDYVQQHDKVWLARRIDIARHWIATHPYPEDE